MPEATPGTVATPTEIKVADIPQGGPRESLDAACLPPEDLRMASSFDCSLCNIIHAEVLAQATEGCQLADCTAKATTAYFVQLALVGGLVPVVGQLWELLWSVTRHPVHSNNDSGMPQENVTNTFAAFASSNDKGFSSPQEFEMRVEVFKENIQQLQELNANASEFVVRLR